MINPASKNKRSYWVSDDQPDDPAAWLAGAQEKPGSWWNDWITWLAPWVQDKVGERAPSSATIFIFKAKRRPEGM